MLQGDGLKKEFQPRLSSKTDTTLTSRRSSGLLRAVAGRDHSTGIRLWLLFLWADVEEHMQQEQVVPTLVVGCARDVMTPASLQDQMTRPHAKSWYCFGLIDAGHWLMLEKPDETNRVLQDFFDEVCEKRH